MHMPIIVAHTFRQDTHSSPLDAPISLVQTLVCLRRACLRWVQGTRSSVPADLQGLQHLPTWHRIGDVVVNNKIHFSVLFLIREHTNDHDRIAQVVPFPVECEIYKDPQSDLPIGKVSDIAPTKHAQHTCTCFTDF